MFSYQTEMRKTSDGQRGRDGGEKKYIIRVQQNERGMYTVIVFYGKASYGCSLVNKEIGTYSNKNTALHTARDIEDKKFAKGYYVKSTKQEGN